MKLLLYYFIFPGFLFSACAGLFAGWLDRKITARIQWRIGPPWHQNFTDIFKLLGKEVIIPQGASKLTFLLSPVIGLLSASLVAMILGLAVYHPQQSYSGDLIVVLYLLLIPAVALIIGASSCGNPLASVGASREIKLVLGYELPFILSVITVVVKSGGIRLSAIINHQALFGSHIISLSGALALAASIICMQAKLGFVPFDMAEAEQEIMAGALIEYSGLGLAIFKLTKALLVYIMPLLLVVLFLGKDLSPLFLILKYISLLTVIVLIKNTNPRLRIDQAMRFFWGPVTLVSALAVIFSLFGL